MSDCNSPNEGCAFSRGMIISPRPSLAFKLQRQPERNNK